MPGRRFTEIATALGLAAVLSLAAPPVAAEPARHAVTGLVLEVLPTRGGFVVSHERIPGFMDAMVMRFDVRDRRELEGVAAGARIAFTLVVDVGVAHAEAVRVLRYESAQQDPQTARRLRLLGDIVGGGRPGAGVAPGEPVPDFRLVDQHGRPVSLADFRGHVVAVNFIYTSCALPEFCFRMANQFSGLQGRFKDVLGRQLTFLTITFDPARDRPDVLALYARRTLNASGEGWRFLTGDTGEIQRVCRLFGVDAFPDEGLMNHSTRTVVIDREGRLAANIEGNEVAAGPLGDLIDAVVRRRP